MLPSANEQQLSRIHFLLTGQTESPLWSPLAGPQTKAYESTADILGYGGSAGGGKSFLLLGLSITSHLRSLILRRETAQGRGLIDDARELLGTLGRFNEQTGVWRNLPGGRQIEFGGVKDVPDVHRYKGRPHDLVAFDEADCFTEYQVRFLLGWLRTTVKTQRCRAVLCFNPPSTSDGRWIIKFFGPWLDKRHPNPARPGELRYFATLRNGTEIERPNGEPFTDSGETIKPKSRTFIPARVTDNPYLMATDYPSQLQAMPEPLRSQLLYGDMEAGLEDDAMQVIPTAWVEAAMARWKPTPPSGRILEAMGVDVARGGADATVIAPRYGPWFAPLLKYPGHHTKDGPAVAALVGKAILTNPHAIVNLDVIGIGSSAYDFCVQSGHNVYPINFGAGCDATDLAGVLRFRNIRAYAYWSMRELLDPARGFDLALPNDPELLGDLTAPRWKPTVQGVQIESKDDIKDRLKRSTDCGDAVVLAVLMPPGGVQGGDTGPTHLIG